MTVEFAECESPTDEPDGLAAMARLLVSRLEPLGLACSTFEPVTEGQRCLVLGRPGWRSRPYQLLVGHLDTVWPAGTLARMPAHSAGGRVAGPGVFDMKAGFVQLIMALAALRAVGRWPALEPVVFANTDEEHGSRESRAQLITLARRAERALVLEPAYGPAGALKTARMGVGHFEVTVQGHAAHSGLEPGSGVSAIKELAHLVGEIYSLAEEPRSTVNVGVLEGGTRHNVVAESARALVELRARDADAAGQLESGLRSLRPRAVGANIAVAGGWDRPPMERTQGNVCLWHHAQSAARAVGISLVEAAVGGASDGNLTSQLTPTLDGLGAVGGGAHALDEHVIIDHLPTRSALLGVVMLACDAK